MTGENPATPEISQTGEKQTGEMPETPPTGNIMGVAVLHCAGTLYGIDVKWVREIRPFAGATPVYGMPAFWVGVTALRGNLYAVLDLQQFLSPSQGAVVSRRQVVFTTVDDFRVGLLAEEMPAVHQIDTQHIIPVSPTEMPYILGTTPDEIIVLDLPGLYTDPRLSTPASQPN